jgi:N-methylhydantoinase B/oxoprolinase/acetone carboxylase alpha subunit
MTAEDRLYGEILNMKLLLRDVAYEFKCYSANDIKKLIASKIKAVREVKALKQLYDLEEAIGNLRSSFSVARAEAKAREAKGATEE